jgi:hypothetical protein
MAAELDEMVPGSGHDLHHQAIGLTGLRRQESGVAVSACCLCGNGRTARDAGGTMNCRRRRGYHER